MIWGRQRKREADLRAAIKSIRESARALERSAQRTDSASTRIEGVLGVVVAPGEPTAREEHRRFLGLLAFCLLTLLYTLVPVYYAIPAFSPPPAVSEKQGAVALALEESSDANIPWTAYNNKSSKDSIPPVLLEGETSFAGEGNGEVKYGLLFPRALAGHKFALVLSGDAVLKDPRTVDGDIYAVKSTTCTDETEAAVTFRESGKGRTCQLLTGIVPETSDAGGQSRCFTHDVSVYMKVRFFGTTDLQSQVDWAHLVHYFPRFETPDTGSFISGPHSTWSGLSLGTDMSFLSPKFCRTVRLSDDYSEYEAGIFGPSLTDGILWQWDQEFAIPIVVGTRRDAATIGNLLLVAIGAGFGLILGFVPVAYEARLSARRARERERRAATSL